MTESKEQPKNSTLTCCQCHLHIADGKIYEIDEFKWHEDCFLCSRCHKKLQKNDSFITLPQNIGTDSTKSCNLICNDCSKNCQHCGKLINDMAIILSSNEAYCQECFKCYKCGKLIDDLKYVKTRKGLYCINCHKVLLAKRQLYKDKQLKQQQEKEHTHSTVQYQERESSSTKANTPESFILPKRSSMRPRNDYLFNSANNYSVHRHSRSLSNSKYTDFEQSIPEQTSKLSMTSLENSVAGLKVNHSRSISLDDVLNATLQNDVTSLNDDENNNNDDDDNGDIINHAKGSQEGDWLVSKDIGNSRTHLITPSNSISNSSISTSNGPVSNTIPYDSEYNSPARSKTSLLDVTENNNMNALLKTPDLNKRSLNVNKTIDLPLNSPMSINTTAMEKSYNNENERVKKRSSRIIDTFQANPLNSLSSLNEGLALHFDNMNGQGSKMMTPDPPIDSNNVLKNKNINNSVITNGIGGRGSNSTTNSGGKKLGRSLSLKSKNFFSHWKSKGHNLTSNDLNDVTEQHKLSQLSNENFDTHSGWGVHSSNENNMHTRINKNTNTANRTSVTPVRHSSRGKSDTLIYNNPQSLVSMNVTRPPNVTISSTGYSTPRNQHQRNNSNTWTDPRSTSGVAMFRTPPLDNQTMFRRIPQQVSNSISKHIPTSNIENSILEKQQPANLRDDTPLLMNGSKTDNVTSVKGSATSTSKKGTTVSQTTKTISQNSTEDTDSDSEDENENFVESVDDMDMKLRKMKLELKEMEVSKQKLIIEIDSLRSQRDELVREVKKLSQSKQMYLNEEAKLSKYNNVSILNDGTNVVRKNVASSDNEEMHLHSTLNGNKPKFWKIFGNNNSLHNTTENLNTTLLSVNKVNTTPSQGRARSNSGNFSNNTSNNGGTSAIASLASATSIENNSLPDTSNPISSYYNLTLHQYCLKNQNDLNVPDIIFKCIDFIETNKCNLETEGLYRKSGSLSLVEEVEKRLYVDNGDLNLTYDDVHVVTNVLKRFLRRLPDPVISFEIYDPLISLVKDDRLIERLPLMLQEETNIENDLFESVKESVTKLLRQLPQENIRVLSLIIRHINLVSQYHRFNLMNLHNLALVFTPSLMRDITGERDMVDMRERNYIVEFTLLHKLV